ncbi:hypothetical protein [Arthrobacter sp. GMC3]|uniref:hypothetical protein n=1 Tax=Arthrobacter sp. GMC3 TaxID=2058894 RepID=UPI0015E28D50|nr:hypothetical protein [Arthrobacter sp. GMC3]
MLTSILRTLIPAWWGLLIAKLLIAVPALEPLREQLISWGDLAALTLSAVIVGAWYALWRWLQPRLPDWLVVILLGSAKTPTYEPLAILAPQVQPGETSGRHDDDKPKHSAADE